jgi:phage shock protein PspC (stress-responsive transcriptional regulator)
MFCTNCGLQLTEDARFCPQCGQGTRIPPTAARSDGYYAPRRLYRLAYDKQIGGVCAGFAKYFDVDVTLIRVLTLAAAVMTGVLPGVIAYILAWIVMPKDEGAMRPSPLIAAAPNH